MWLLGKMTPEFETPGKSTPQRGQTLGVVVWGPTRIFCLVWCVVNFYHNFQLSPQASKRKPTFIFEMAKLVEGD